MNFYKRHIGDYIRDTAHLSLLEHGVYTRLMDVYYVREAPLPAEQVARLVGAKSKEERDALAALLDEFFIRDGETWRHKRCDEEIEAATAQARTNRRISAEREAKRGKRTVNEPSNESLHEPPTNRLPVTSGEREGIVNLSRLQTPDSRLH